MFTACSRHAMCESAFTLETFMYIDDGKWQVRINKQILRPWIRWFALTRFLRNSRLFNNISWIILKPNFVKTRQINVSSERSHTDTYREIYSFSIHGFCAAVDPGHLGRPFIYLPNYTDWAIPVRVSNLWRNIGGFSQVFTPLSERNPGNSNFPLHLLFKFCIIEIS